MSRRRPEGLFRFLGLHPAVRISRRLRTLWRLVLVVGLVAGPLAVAAAPDVRHALSRGSAHAALAAGQLPAAVHGKAAASVRKAVHHRPSSLPVVTLTAVVVVALLRLFAGRRPAVVLGTRHRCVE